MDRRPQSPILRRRQIKAVLVVSQIVVAVLALIGGLAAPVAAVVPSAPRALLAPVTPTAIEASWQAPAANGGSPITGYTVELRQRGGVNNGVVLESQTVVGLAATLSRPVAGAYQVRVVANNVDGPSAAAARNLNVVALRAPSVPRTVSATVGADGIAVAWVAPAAPGDRPIESYRVDLRSVDQLVQQVLVGPQVLSTLLELPPPGPYQVSVVAVSAAGESAAVTRSVTVLGVPGVPTALTVTENASGALVVRWRPPTTTGGSPITGYRVIVDGVPLDVGPGRRSVVVADIVPGVHAVSVQARNIAGISGPAEVVFINVTNPGAPAEVSAFADDGGVSVSWSPPANTGGDITGYDVEVGGESQRVGQETSVVVADLAAADYSVRVRAYNDAGVGPWASGPTVAIVDRPSEPLDVDSDVVGQQLTVTWNAPADNGNSPVTGYLVRVGNQETTVTGTTYVLDDVPSGRWDVEVAALNAVGQGPGAVAGAVEIVRDFEPFDNSDEFVRQLYLDFLGRGADQGGLAFWRGRLESERQMSATVNGISQSSELETERKVVRLYLAVFDRSPDAAGLAYWSQQLEAGVPLHEVAEGFVSSTEFTSRYGGLNDSQFVVLVYNRVLARQPDVGGFRYWVAQLRRGTGRGALMSLVAESPEFVGASRAAVDLIVVYNGLLQRPPTTAELGLGLSDIRRAGGRRGPAIDRVLATVEFRDRVAD